MSERHQDLRLGTKNVKSQRQIAGAFGGEIQ
jgi:hypothetical protein